MGNTSNPVVLVTGCSSGIGLALARLLYKSHYRVVATARDSSFEKLTKEFKETDRFLMRRLDVNDQEQRSSVVEEAFDRWKQIDILVNNAGISYRSVIEHMAEGDSDLQIQTNFLSPMALTRLVLPGMRQNRRGKIINLSSVGGMMAMPTMASYSSAKFALEGASEALWYEMKPWDVSVTIIQPGFVHSHSFKHIYLSKLAKDASENPSDPYYPYYKFMEPFIARMMNAAFATPDSIAKKIYRVMESKNPPLRKPVTWDARVFDALRRALPRRFYHWFLYRNLPGIRHWGKEELSSSESDTQITMY